MLCFELFVNVLCFINQGDNKMATNMIPGAAFFSGSETFLRDLSPEDELMITGGGGSGSKSKTSKSKSKSKS
jgi:hypothetical protein